MPNNLTILYHSLPLVFNSVIIRTFWQQASLVLLHLHAPVHGSPTFWWLHFIVLHPDLQPQFTISSQLSGTKVRDIDLGMSLSFSLDQPIVSGSGRVGFVRWACFHIIAWKWALLICSRAASLIGGRASGDRHLENNVVHASLQLSASATLYTLQMNFSADVIVTIS